MAMISEGSRNCSKGDSEMWDAGGKDVDRSYNSIPPGNARGENMSTQCQDQQLHVRDNFSVDSYSYLVGHLG
jgi:hypothetical protein